MVLQAGFFIVIVTIVIGIQVGLAKGAEEVVREKSRRAR